VPKFVKILLRANLRREILPFLVWFFKNRGWMIWVTAWPLVKATIPFQRKEGEDATVVIAGDSLAMGVGLKNPETTSVAALLADYYRESPVINLGTIGYCIGDMLNVFSDSNGSPKYKCVVLIVGTMDMVANTPSEELERNLRELFSRLGRMTDHVVLVQAGSMKAGPRFVGHTTFLESLGKRSDRVHQLFERVTKDFAHVHYMGDLFNWSLLESTQNEPERWFSPDGFHPSEAWHYRVFCILRGILEGRGVISGV
jgi:lysophospholipase L1-like esterase